MTSAFFTYNNSKVHYRLFGNGPKLLFCFHGYGRDGYTFGFLEKSLGQKFTIVALDAPFHGHTQWDDPVFKPTDLVSVLEQLATTLGNSTSKISLLGFSMGGRIVLNVTQHFASRIERIVLLAPDGLKFNFWHWFSTHTWLGNQIFDYTVHKPAWLLKAVLIAQKRGVITRNLAVFVRYYLENGDERFVLYRRWIIMKKFRPRLSSVKKTILKNQIKVRMLFGSYDKIIHSAGGHKFLRSLEAYATVDIIDAGHDVLREWHAQTIANLFND